MIVPMHKYAFLVFHADYSVFLENLKELGVLHVIQSANEPTPAIQDAIQQVSEVSKLLVYLKKYSADSDTKSAVTGDAQELIATIKKLRVDLEQLGQAHLALDKSIKQLLPWGSFNWDDLKAMQAQTNLQVRFYACSLQKYIAIQGSDYTIEEISRDKGNVYFVLLSRSGDAEPTLDADEIQLPAQSLSELQNELKIVDEKEALCLTQLQTLSQQSPILELFCEQIKEQISDDLVLLHTSNEVEGNVKLLEGWVPDTVKAQVDEFLDAQGVYYLNHEGVIEDNPPVLLKNNRFSRLFESISNLYSLPAYNEIDLTPYLAPFYLLFFGFCFSDAGYGLLFVLVASYLKFKQKGSTSVLSLVQLLGASTMVFGLLSGSFFGIELYSTNLPFYSNIAQAYGSIERPIGKVIQDIMFKASLGLGLIQILFGMFLRAAKLIKQKGVLHAVSTFGWAFLIISSLINAVFVNNEVVIFFNGFYVGFASLCLVGIFFMNTPGKNLLLNFGVGIWDTYNTVVGGVGDLLSYVRLFALGLASAILGLVFNNLALKLFTPDSSFVMQVVGFVLMILVLLVGHSINIFMSGLGSMVHPLRLTFVEFYKNAGFEGGGKAYKPFKKYTQENK